MILLFINTVHLDPKSTGDFATSPALEKSETGRLRVAARVYINEPQPNSINWIRIMINK